MESINRNNQGRFVSGHKGAKPKGAINKSTRDYLVYLDKISSLLESSLEENIRSLSKKEQVMFWFEIEKFKHLKLSKFTEPEPEKEQITKITFEVVDSQGKPYHDPPDTPAASSAEVPAPPQQGQVPTVDNAPILYGAIDQGRVRKPNYFKRTSSF